MFHANKWVMFWKKISFMFSSLTNESSYKLSVNFCDIKAIKHFGTCCKMMLRVTPLHVRLQHSARFCDYFPIAAHHIVFYSWLHTSPYRWLRFALKWFRENLWNCGWSENFHFHLWNRRQIVLKPTGFLYTVWVW